MPKDDDDDDNDEDDDDEEEGARIDLGSQLMLQSLIQGKLPGHAVENFKVLRAHTAEVAELRATGFRLPSASEIAAYALFP